MNRKVEKSFFHYAHFLACQHIPHTTNWWWRRSKKLCGQNWNKVHITHAVVESIETWVGESTKRHASASWLTSAQMLQPSRKCQCSVSRRKVAHLRSIFGGSSPEASKCREYLLWNAWKWNNFRLAGLLEWVWWSEYILGKENWGRPKQGLRSLHHMLHLCTTIVTCYIWLVSRLLIPPMESNMCILPWQLCGSSSIQRDQSLLKAQLLGSQSWCQFTWKVLADFNTQIWLLVGRKSLAWELWCHRECLGWVLSGKVLQWWAQAQREDVVRGQQLAGRNWTRQRLSSWEY